MLRALLLLGCLLAVEQPAQSPDPAAEVRRLVAQLDSPKLADRETAEAALVKLGPEVLPLLPGDDAPLGAEAKQRLDRARRKLEEQASANVFEPSCVTLKKQTLRLSRLLEEIERQTGNRVVNAGRSDSDPELTVEFDKKPFWEVLERVADQAGMTVRLFGEGKAISLVERPEGALPFGQNASLAGPFMFVPMDWTARRELESENQGSLRLNLAVLWEPRLTPIGLTQKLKEVAAIDDEENLLSLGDQQGALEAPVGVEATSVRLSLPFALPSREVQRVAHISGTLDALLTGPAKAFRFDKLSIAKEVKKTIAEAAVTLESVRKQDDVYEVSVRVRFANAGDALASHRGWIFANPAYMEGPHGERVDNEGFETTMQTEDEVGLTYYFDLEQPLDQYAFVYKTPVKIFAAKYRYEFDDLELP